HLCGARSTLRYKRSIGLVIRTEARHEPQSDSPCTCPQPLTASIGKSDLANRPNASSGASRAWLFSAVLVQAQSLENKVHMANEVAKVEELVQLLGGNQFRDGGIGPH